MSKLRAELEKILAELATLAFNPEDEPKLRAEREAMEARRVQLRDIVDELSARLASVSFSYSDPVKNFDRSKVGGLVAELITVDDVSNATALEVTAGGRLYNVVVADEVTGKQLLANGKLRRRVTIIPLNKVKGRKTEASVVAEAKRQVGAENVDLALSLVGYPDEVANAMEYVFGNTLVCKTMDMARKVTFHEKIRTRAVTLDGDVFDPSGTLTGGAKSSSSGVLQELQKLQGARYELAACEAKLAELTATLKELASTGAKYSALTTKRDMKQNELDILLVKLDSNESYKVGGC